MKILHLVGLIAVAAVPFAAMPALADREPTSEERSVIEAALAGWATSVGKRSNSTTAPGRSTTRARPTARNTT